MFRPLLAPLLALCVMLPTAATAATDLAALEATSATPLHVVRAGGAVHALRGFRAGPYAGEPAEAAAAFASRIRPVLGLDDTAAELGAARTHSWRGRPTVRFAQFHRGVEVLGKALVVRLDGQGHAVMLLSDLAVGLDAHTTPATTAADARQIALEAVAGAVPYPPAATLRIDPDGRGGRLVWRVRVDTVSPPAAWMVTLDAHTGGVLDVSDLRLDAQGHAYEHNPENSEVITVELTDLDDGDVTDGTYALVRSTVFTDGVAAEEFLAAADGSGDFFFDPDEPSAEDPFAEVHTYWHVTEVSRYFEQVHGHAFDGPALVTTNYRASEDVGFDNAYFTTNMMGDTLLVFGQGQVDFAYDADVIAHEFGHSVIQARTDMVFDGLISYDEYGWNIAPGAIHEGMADYWSSTWHDDPVMGEYLAVLGATRDLENDYSCPDHIIGEPHYDGEIIGGATWALREAVGAEVADSLLYGALGLLTPTPSFADLGEAIAQLAGELVDDGVLTADEAADIDAILDERGLLLCGREMPLVDEVSQTVPIPGAQLISEELCEFARNLGAVFSTHFQYAVQVPEEGTLDRLTLTVGQVRQDLGGLDPGDLQYSIYARTGDLITYDFEYLDLVVYQLALPQADQYDLAWEEQTEQELVLEFEAGGELNWEPGDTLYFGMTHMNCPNIHLTVTADLEVTEPPADDDDDDDDDLEQPVDDDDDPDCSCSAAGHGARPILSALTGLAALVAYRRRR
jgi:MYXO-CTERM domain-containing protein